MHQHGGSVVRRRRVWVGASVEQYRCHLQMAALGRMHQGGGSVVRRRRVWVGASVEQHRGHLQMALLGRNHHRGESSHPNLEAGSIIKQKVDLREVPVGGSAKEVHGRLLCS
jgi:hypothetical protein